MSVLLQIHNLHKSYGGVTILEDATAAFSENQKIGFIGRNGAGKSTLCKIITGEEKTESGSVTKNGDLKLGYLEQHDPFRPEETVLGFLIRYSGREEWQCAELAAKFHLTYEFLEKKIGALAGGYQTRLKLAAMLLNDPNFLVLDEPTNYLDLSTLILLEHFLQQFKGGFLIVSHDREFLKRTCDHTLEVENGSLTLYPGTIEEYFEFKEEQRRHRVAHNKAVEKKKEQLQIFIDRFRAKASTASRAKSKMKQLGRLKTIQIEHPMGHVRIRIPAVEPKTGIALSCNQLEIGYPEKVVAGKINLEIDRGAHIAILGDNGQGKTTFMRTLAGELAVRAGSFKWGWGLKIAYYAQHVFGKLHPQDDIYTHLEREAAPGVTSQDILNLAGCFLFKGDDVKKKVSVLSGGERARLCLAGLLLTKSHVLLLDEPTNHLDFETVEALGQALKKFSGTVFFISHDRTFVNLIATTVVDIKNGSVARYPGTYEDYVYHLEVEATNEFGQTDQLQEEVIAEPASPAQADLKPERNSADENSDYLKRKEAKSQLAQIKTTMNRLERQIDHLTQDREKLFEEMKKNPFYYSKERNERFKKTAAMLEEAERSWLELQANFDRLKKELG